MPRPKALGLLAKSFALHPKVLARKANALDGFVIILAKTPKRIIKRPKRLGIKTKNPLQDGNGFFLIQKKIYWIGGSTVLPVLGKNCFSSFILPSKLGVPCPAR